MMALLIPASQLVCAQPRELLNQMTEPSAPQVHVAQAKTSLDVACGLEISPSKPGPSPQWRLGQLYQSSLPHEARLRMAEASLRAAQAQLDMAQSQRLPALAFSASRLGNRLDSAAPNILGQVNSMQDRYFSFNQTLNLRQPLYRPALGASVRSAQAQVQAVALQQDLEKSTLAALTTATYLDVLLAQSQLNLAATHVQRQRTLWETASRDYSAGSGTVTETQETRARLELAFVDQGDARSYMQMAQHQLGLLIGASPVPVEPTQTPDLTNLLKVDEQQVQHWLDLALRDNVEIRQLQIRQQAAQEDIARARAGHQPTLDLLVQRTRSGNENITRINSSYDNISYGLQLNVPLYAGGYVSAQVRQVVAEHEKASSALDGAKTELNLRVFKEFRQLTDALRRHTALQQSMLAARTALRAANMSQQSGLKSNADVAQAALNQATVEHELLKVEYQALLSKLRLGLLVASDANAVESKITELQSLMYASKARCTPVSASTLAAH
jgi:outer membrane protein/protease secretion system outer membrane protein